MHVTLHREPTSPSISPFAAGMALTASFTSMPCWAINCHGETKRKSVSLWGGLHDHHHGFMRRGVVLRRRQDVAVGFLPIGNTTSVIGSLGVGMYLVRNQTLCRLTYEWSGRLNTDPESSPRVGETTYGLQSGHPVTADRPPFFWTRCTLQVQPQATLTAPGNHRFPPPAPAPHSSEDAIISVSFIATDPCSAL